MPKAATKQTSQFTSGQVADNRGIETATSVSKSALKAKGSSKKWALLVIAIVLIVGGGYLLSTYVGAEVGSDSSWQAVFLTNGQVYFGHVVQEGKATVVLRDIYYLQVTSPLQQAEDEGEQTNELSLVKLGNELHGPKDEMRIVRENVLFVEDLKEDSKVVQAIERYIAGQQE
jgi:hypothetical protein